jgi:hypothetical protein
MSDDKFTPEDAQALVDFDKHCANAENALSKLCASAAETNRRFYTYILMEAVGKLFEARAKVGIILMHMRGKIAPGVEVIEEASKPDPATKEG